MSAFAFLGSLQSCARLLTDLHVACGRLFDCCMLKGLRVGLDNAGSSTSKPATKTVTQVGDHHQHHWGLASPT